jgi:hypothetical protein
MGGAINDVQVIAITFNFRGDGGSFIEFRHGDYGRDHSPGNASR